MHPSQLPESENGRFAFRLGLFLAVVLGVAGCQTAPMNKVVLGPDYKPSNVYRRDERLPLTFRRIAVLPLTWDESHAEASAGAMALEGGLRTELLKTAKFELLWISPDALGRWTGKKDWKADEELPSDLFRKLREEVGCDGVLFCRLSRFRPYPPLAVGWNLRLIDAADAQPVWAVDELFDSGEPAVSNSARRYEQQHQKGGPSTDAPLILTSPSRFGQYAASAVLGTLPAR